MAINPASLFDLPGDPLLDKLKRALSQLHERTEVVEAAASALQAGQVQAVDDLVQQITTNFSELFTDGSVVVQALQEGRYTSADIDGPVVFNVQNGLSLTLDVSGPIGFSPAPIVMIGHKASTDDFALARVVSWNRETNTLVVDMLTWVGATGPHSDCYVEVGLLSALAELAMLEEVQVLLGSTENARDAALSYRNQAAGHVTSAAGEKDQAIAARNLAQGYATTASGARDTALGYRDQAAASAALAAASAGQIIDVLDRVDVLPTLNLDLTDINGAPYKGNLTRATNGGYRLNSKGILVPTAVNEPVIDYGSDGKPKGTGFFGAYTNLLTYSEQFDLWAIARATVTTNAIAAPDGTMTADKLCHNNIVGDGGGYAAANGSWTAALAYTFSIFLKAGEDTSAQLDFIHAGGFDTSSRLVVNLTAGTLSGAAAAASKIENAGNGWWRVHLHRVPVNTVASVRISLTGDTANNNGFYLWGAQLTQTAFPVPYVPTTSAAVVRNADSFVIGGSDFTDFFNPLEGTVFAYFIMPAGPAGASGNYVWQIRNLANPDNRLALRVNNDMTSTCVCQTSGGLQAGLAIPAMTGGQLVRAVFSWRKDMFLASFNGASAVSDNLGNVPDGLDQLIIGSRAGDYLSSYISRLIYWPKALTATDLQRITA